MSYGASFRDKVISSVYLEGAVPSKTIPDNFGKSLDAITNEIKNVYIRDLDTKFKEWVHAMGGKIQGMFSKFLSKLNLKSFGLSSDAIKSMIEKGKDILGYVGTGLSVYNDIKNKNYEGLMDFSRGLLGNNIVDAAQFGLQAYRDIKATDWHNFESIMGTVSKLTGVDIANVIGYADLKAKIGAVLSLAQKYGVTDAFKYLREKFGKNKDMAYQLALGLKQNTLLSQTDTINEILKLINGKLAGSVYPELVYDLFKNYKFPKVDYNDDDLKRWKKEILDICQKVDPNWAYETIDGVKYQKLQPWMAISQHAKMLFQHDEEFGASVVIASSYTTKTTRQCLNDMYRYLNL